MRREFEYVVKSEKGFDETVEAVQEKGKENGFGVLHVHDVQATLTSKGFPRGPLKIIELCRPDFASRVLDKDIMISLMMPCPVSVYEKDGETYIATMRPESLAGFYPDAGIDDVAKKADELLMKAIETARQ